MTGGEEAKARFSGLKFPAMMFLVFWALAILFWRKSGQIFFLFNFGYLGTALGLGIGLYRFLPKRKKPAGRKLTQFLVGGYMLGFLGLLGFENMQLEGFFLYALAGLFSGAVIHYLIAKLAGPLLFGRGFCGWACWTAMVLDLLPFPHSRGWVPGGWKWLRYVHFLASLGLVLIVCYGFGYSARHQGIRALYGLLAGNVFYFATGVPLAYALKDNRAFCKYLCPVPVVMKVPSRFSLLKIATDREKCDYCEACLRTCPMDVAITEYVRRGQRVVSSECILCETCVSVCPQQALRLNFGLDAGFRERLVQRPG